MNQELDKERAEELFNSYSAYIFRVALLLTGSAALADDVTQETFLKVFKHFHTYDQMKPIEPWIHRIAINTARNLLRKQRWLSFVGIHPDGAQEESLEVSVIQEAENKELWKEVGQLPLKSREVIIMHFYSGLKLREIADSLQIPLGTCKSRLHSALSSLRKQLPENEMFRSPIGGEML
ncbi:RNA polymerase sigma-70 factor (ECF subfamily) [Paenibacillus taihuensis]|uniref:RNA polymerase sigma factor n=1 Tax=Paenibacillus taihuensis TaxID=1156355 RepID=A0A3D9RHB5_9BACL|nr:RNA polymerase sigma factor [Paenibacillus taihuensis]REE77708.1 RNA polymerase sigma-70 factor (ECF subfamily) [Paenibacillus taihuensis]